MALISLRFFSKRSWSLVSRWKKVIAVALMLASCSWTPGKGKDREDLFSNTAYQLLNLFLPEVCFLQAKGKTADNEKISIKFCRAKDKPVLTYPDTLIDLFTYLNIFIPILSLPPLWQSSACSIYLWVCFCFVLFFICCFFFVFFFRFYI